MRRGLRVLRVLADHPEGLTVSELADELVTHRASIYRLLGPLTEERLVVRGGGGRHLLGLGLLELASAVRPRLQEVAARTLRPLADELRATTALTIRDGADAVVAFVAEPSGTDMHIAYRPGLRHAIALAAPGLAILAAGAPQPGRAAGDPGHAGARLVAELGRDPAWRDRRGGGDRRAPATRRKPASAPSGSMTATPCRTARPSCAPRERSPAGPQCRRPDGRSATAGLAERADRAWPSGVEGQARDRLDQLLLGDAVLQGASRMSSSS